MKKFTLLLLLLLCAMQTKVFGASIKLDGKAVTLDLSGLTGTSFDIYRAKGRFAPKVIVKQGVTEKTYTDSSFGDDSPYEYYYLIQQGENVLDTLSLNRELFGKNVYFYSPADDNQKITAEFDTIGARMRYQQFGNGRYAIYFMPGEYKDLGSLHIGFYTSVAGLGKLPKDVKAYCPVTTPSPMSDADPDDFDGMLWEANINSTQTFWRSMENMAVMLKDGEKLEGAEHAFIWGVSQAAPLRRVYTNRRTEYDYLSGWASGGFTGDCSFDAPAGSYSQQQWYSRNCYFKNGAQGFSPGGWNNCYQGATFGSGVDMSQHSDNWGDKMIEASDTTTASGWSWVSREETTPIMREKPFIFLGDDGRYKVFRPAIRKDSKGPSWTDTNMGDGEVIDLIDNFYIAKPGATAREVNEQLDKGKSIIFAPGIYRLEEPIYVKNPNTIVMGLGFATLIPTKANSECALKVADVDGVTITGFLFDTEWSSKELLLVGERTSHVSHADNPTLLADLFFRVGGAYTNAVNVDHGIVIKSNDVIGDHFWVWRADHGEGTGWRMNTSKNGIVIYGDNVSLYGMFNEHFQQYQLLWLGENGKLFFYQCETPYDPVNQDAFLSHKDPESGEQANGYSAYKVAVGIKHHYASMLGIYDVFIHTNNQKVQIRNSVEIPAGEEDVKVHHVCNVCISSLPYCGFTYVIGDKCKSTYWTNQGEANAGVSKRYAVPDFDGTMTDLVWKNDVHAPTDKETDHVTGIKNVNLDVPATNGTVTLYNASGMRIANFKNTGDVDMSGFTPGLYIVKITNNQGENIVRKVIKK